MSVKNQIKESRVGSFVYRHSLLMFLAAARALQRVRYPIPNHWDSFIETVQVSSEVACSRIALNESEVEEEFQEKREKLVKLTDRKLYSEKDIDEIQEECEVRGF